MPKPHLALLLALVAAFGISHFSDQIDPYHLDVIIGIGINVILAVSLNLVNGYTGQFSLGHAGFMSVGAYTAAVLGGEAQGDVIGLGLDMVIWLPLAGLVPALVAFVLAPALGITLLVVTLISAAVLGVPA